MAAARARGAIVGIEPAAEELEVCEDDEDEEVEVEEEAMDDDVAVLELVVGCEAGLADADAEDVADADPKERVEPETIRLDPDTEAEGRMACAGRDNEGCRACINAETGERGNSIVSIGIAHVSSALEALLCVR